jgi:Uma2 family endonuclease
MSVAAIPMPSPILGDFTADALLAEPYDKGYELEDGLLVEMKVSVESSWVAGEIFGRLRDVCRAEQLGWVFPEGTSYQCFPDHPNRVRKPDVSFIRSGRIPGEKLTAGHLKLAPDLVVEVLSPNDLIYRVDRKVRQYFEVGVQLVWVVNPDARTIVAHLPDGAARVYTDSQEIPAAPVLPTLRFRVADVFPPQAAGVASDAE